MSINLLECRVHNGTRALRALLQKQSKRVEGLHLCASSLQRKSPSWISIKCNQGHPLGLQSFQKYHRSQTASRPPRPHPPPPPLAKRKRCRRRRCATASTTSACSISKTADTSHSTSRRWSRRSSSWRGRRGRCSFISRQRDGIILRAYLMIIWLFMVALTTGNYR